MKHVTFFRLSLALPLVIPLPFACLLVAVPLPAIPLPVRYPAILLVLSLFFGGIPYLFFAASAVRELGNQSLIEIRRKVATAPLRFCRWYSTFILALSALYALASWQLEPLGFIFFGVVGLPVILVLGYLYVFLVKSLHTFFHDRGLLTSAPAAA